MLKDLEYYPTYASGQNEPIDFYCNCLINSISLDLALGYFRSTGFKSLALGFATFLYHGGKMRFIINDSLTEKDKTTILQGQEEIPDKEYEQQLLNDLRELIKTLKKRDQHFFNCLSWMIASDRLQIIAVKPKKNKVGIVHHKFGIFTDVSGNRVVFNGSVNFSQFALERNVETLWAECSWLASGMSEMRINDTLKLFDTTWNGESTVVRIIPIEEVKTEISRLFPKKVIQDLIEDERQLVLEAIEEQKVSEYKTTSLKKILETVSSITITNELKQDFPAIGHCKYKLLCPKRMRGRAYMRAGSLV